MIYDMITEPCDAQYRALMDYAMAHSDAVMLVFSVKKGSKLQNDTKRTVRNQLAPWRIKSRHAPNGRSHSRIIEMKNY